MIQRLVTAGRQTEYLNLDLVALDDGDSCSLSSDLETAAVVLSGQVDVLLDGRSVGSAGQRRSVFEGPGHVIYVPPGSSAEAAAVGGRAELAITSASPGPAPPGPARVIGPPDQQVVVVGEGNWSRTVRTILGPQQAASRLLLGETVNPPGNWSSYPPHRHDVEAPPEQVRLEEVYLFKMNPQSGFGVQIRYDDEGHDEAALVRNDDYCVISSGYHPVVAAPGYALYYLWIMAGPGRELAPCFDVRHAWVQHRTRVTPSTGPEGP